MATTYPVACECGATLLVSGGAAGTQIPCQCGRTVDVPTLGCLKSSVGEAAISPDFELEHLISSGDLPLESRCVVCELDTTHEREFAIVCERPEEKGSVPFWQQLLLIWISPIIFLMHMTMTSRRIETHGRDVAFRLPVRVCEECVGTLNATSAIRNALEVTPVYARLLKKYPHARIG
ncbi:hypothetical protein [Fimbriiglobus ruber]|uniref:Uncharacterized protein n=1 Tax=Fimbriiglobus ruber TaxID=1908690 RepID=A0A225E019_9BACT|nr:hypothetical protein [Fimbriiglobus ruber]OWK41707.1 hypothetical protein FRUB_03785 [Fimbriiglobus ruber]